MPMLPTTQKLYNLARAERLEAAGLCVQCGTERRHVTPARTHVRCAACLNVEADKARTRRPRGPGRRPGITPKCRHCRSPEHNAQRCER